MKKIIVLSVMTIFVAGCSTTSNVVVPPPAPDIQPIDSALTEPCPTPIRLPERNLNQGEVERYWSIDRGNLRVCANRMSALVEAIEDRDARITNQ